MTASIDELIAAARGLKAADDAVQAYIDNNQHQWVQAEYERLCDKRDEAMLPIIDWVRADGHTGDVADAD